VVSLVPSATETLVAWGIEPVGVTRFCEHPSAPAVGGTKDPDVAAVVALAPDLVVLCEEENRRQDAEALEAAGLELHVLRIDTVEDVAAELSSLAARLGVAPPLDSTGGWRSDREGARATAWVPIWRRPWMALGPGCYGSSLLASLGVATVPVRVEDRYPTLDLDEAAALAPDLVLAPSEPYPFGERHRAELEAVAPVVLVDGRDLFWWGERTPAARVRLAAVLAPFLDVPARGGR
jgi:ABC-type Fe3+-hydroxamate transport system substrate-binding protein